MSGLPTISTALTDLLEIKYPIIMAPMFLVSNVAMVIEATKSGITGAIPALNFRTDREFRQALVTLKENTVGPFGINLIVNRSNFRLKEQLNACLDNKVDFVITSLGNPQTVIQMCHDRGILVFCDVTDQKYGAKVAAMNPDALIAVNNLAGGHAGQMNSKELIAMLKSITDKPIISAGGVGLGSQLYDRIQEGACGISMGSPFIASRESPVSNDYKQACIDFGSSSIVMTSKLSGTPCTVINTPYVRMTGTKQTFLEAFLNKNRYFKKLAKSLTYFKGMQKLKRAAFSNTYQTVWCAGPSIEYVHEILPVQKIVSNLVEGYYNHLKSIRPYV